MCVIANSSMCSSLQDMLLHNHTLHYLDVTWPLISCPCLSSLIASLKGNTSLQGLSVPILLLPYTNELMVTFFDVVSQKNNITQLKVDFVVDQHSMQSLGIFIDLGLPIVTTILKSHKTIRLLSIMCRGRITITFNWRKIAQDFFETIFRHPLLEYIVIDTLDLNLKKHFEKGTERDIHCSTQTIPTTETTTCDNV